MSLIDLGEVGFDEETEPAAPPPPPWLRRLGVPGRRKAAAVAALAFLAGGLGGTAPATVPEPPVRVLDGVTMQSTLSIVGDTLLRVGGDAMVLTATDLPSGAILWSNTIGQTVFRLDGAGGAVAVQTGPTPGFEVVVPSEENMTRALARGHLTVLDARTGAQRWRHAGALVGSYDSEGPLVMLVPSENVTGAFSGWFLVGVDGRDGHDLWAQPLADGAQWIFRYAEARPDRLDSTTVTVMGSDGSLSAVDTLTGRRTPIGRLPAGSTLEWGWMDLLGVRRPDPPALGDPARAPGPGGDPGPGGVSRRFEVYSLAALDAPLWGMPLAPDQQDWVPTPCRENVLCTPRPDAVIGTDVRTGAPAAAPDMSVPDSIGIWRTQIGVLASGGISATDSASATAGGDNAAAIAFVSPAASKTREGWLGVVLMRRSAPEVVPVARIPLSIEICWPSTQQWIVCPGSAGAVVLRQSDVEATIAAVHAS